jgi:hypothetical protein
MKCDYAYIYPTGHSPQPRLRRSEHAMPQPLVREWLVQADDFHRNPQRVSQRDWLRPIWVLWNIKKPLS